MKDLEEKWILDMIRSDMSIEQIIQNIERRKEFEEQTNNNVRPEEKNMFKSNRLC